MKDANLYAVLWEGEEVYVAASSYAGAETSWLAYSREAADDEGFCEEPELIRLVANAAHVAWDSFRAED